MYKNEKGNDWELRKRMRLKQVRQQSREFAHELRTKVDNEQKQKLKEIEHTKQAEHSNWKSKTLNEINKEYIECLKNIGKAHANALEDKCAPFQEGREKPGQHNNVDFTHNITDKAEKLLPAVIVPTKIAPVVSKSKYKKSTLTGSISSKKMKNKEKEHKNTQTEDCLSLEKPVNLDESTRSKLIDTNTSTSQENKENESVPPKFVIKPHFSEVSNLLNKSSSSTVRYLEEENENDKLSVFDSKPHFSQISNLLKKNAVSQNIAQKNDEMDKTGPESHFSQVSDLLKQRRTNQARTICGGQTLPQETNELKRRPSVVSFKSIKDSVLVTDTTGETYRQPIFNAKNQNNPFATCDGTHQPPVDSKVQMYDNRTKFSKEYIPQQPLTQRTSTSRDSPNAMELANEENERMRAHINAVDDRLKKDLERGINAIEREKLMRKYKSLLNELELLSTEEKTLKGFIQAHQPFQNEPKMQNTRQFLEKRTIITSSEVLKHNSNYINVASIKSTDSNHSEGSRKSIVLDYEESLILDNLSETKVNSNDTHRFSNKASPTISRKLAKESETQTSVRDAAVETVKIPTIASNGKKLYDVPLKITIQIQPSDRQESLVITPKETNLRLSQLESNSSSLTEYRSLPKIFTGSSRPPTEQILTGTSKPSQQFRNSYETNKQIKEAELEGYIRRLLQMSKESVDELPSVTEVPCIRESIIDTGNADDLKFSAQNKKTSEISRQMGNHLWQKNDFQFSTFSKSSMTSETSSISTTKSAKVSILKATSCSLLSSSSENGCDLSEQFDALTQNCNQRIIELTNLMSKVRIERQQILEQTSLSSGTANMPNNSTEYHELPSRLLLVPQKLPSPPIEKRQPNKKFHDLSTIIEMGPQNTQLKLEKPPPLNVSKIINEMFIKSSSDPKIDVVPYQSEEKLEEANDSEGSLLDIYAELKRRDLVPMGLKKLMESNGDSQSTELLPSLNDNDSVCTVTTESLLGFSDGNRRSLLAHSLSSNPKSSSSTSSSVSQPALNLKEFLERELTKKNNSSDSGTSSNQLNTELGHRTSTPVTKHSSSKSLYLSIDVQSNLFSAESQISSVKSDTTTSNWDSA